MTAMEPPRRRLRLWHWIVGGLIVLLMALAIGVPIWLQSTADIDAFHERARARGIATTWEEVAAERPFDPERAAVFQELIQLVDGVQAWQELDPDNTIVAGEPLPEALREHHEALGPQFWPQVSDLIRQLEGRPVVVHQIIDFSTLQPEIAAMRRLNTLLCEAWLLEMIAVEVLLDQPDLLESAVLIMGLVRARMRQTTLRSLLQRPPVELSDRARSRIEGWASQAHPEIAGALKYELICSITTIRSVALQPRGISIFSVGELGDNLLFRWSRSDSLDLLSEMVPAAMTGPGLVEQAEAFKRLNLYSLTLHQGLARFRYELVGLFMPALVRSQADFASIALASSVVLHELGYGPWPDDPFAPPGTPLRRHERDGVLIGAWSVGSDGVDDGGPEGYDDIRIELRPPWDAPKPSP